MVNLLPQLWQLTQPASVVEAQYSSYRISAFTLANSNTVATLVGEVALSLTSDFTIARPFQQTIINDDTSYIIAIRYTDTQGITYRYVLFDAMECSQFSGLITQVRSLVRAPLSKFGRIRMKL